MERLSVSKRGREWKGWALIAGLLLVANACRPFPSPPLTPTQEIVPTARQGLATPTPTATWTVAPTYTPPQEGPTATLLPVSDFTSTPVPETPTPVLPDTPTSELTATPTSEPTATPTGTLAPERPTATATRAPSATPIPTATSSLAAATRWRGEYYNNPDLWGNPAVVREDQAIGFDWQENAPAPGLPADAFSVRWSATATFQEGSYNFHATMDDGMRVYVDGERIIDEWRDMPAREVVASRHMTAGSHVLRVEYYERGHKALAKLWWERDRSFAGWKGMYWPNLSFLGNPVLIRDDPNISFDWLMDGPGSGMPVDRFSVRWTRTLYLEEGSYRFRVQVDDGVRLWVDGEQLIDAWYDHSFHELTADHVIGGMGPHTIVVEYYDNTFEARIHVNWERRGAPSYAQWKGEYFANKDLSGEPVLVRNDRTLTFDWGTTAPAAGVPADRFSVRWTREREFEPGRYRFRVRADDGVRFYVDDALLVNEWHNTWGETYQVDVDLTWKPRLRVEFYEDGGDARIEFGWERIGG
jgi:hypothetical protein